MCSLSWLEHMQGEFLDGLNGMGHPIRFDVPSLPKVSSMTPSSSLTKIEMLGKLGESCDYDSSP